jgi:tRNA threonylcarbamoyladenosine modification (KEOPS) complex Cgi121 subunit
VPTVARPKPINLTDTRLYVVNQDNLEDFLKEFEAENGNVAFVAFSVKDYENLALNIAELRRFIKQQGEIIVYYENAVSESEQ